LAQDLKKWAPTQADKQFSPDAQRPDSSSEAVVSAQEQAAEVAAAPAPTQSPIQSKESLQARAAEPVFSDQATVAKAKPAVINPAINGGGSAAPPSQQNQLTTLPLYRAPARWTINSSGILQRSFDGGKSWLAVHVDTTAAASANDTMTRTAPAKAATGGVPAERVAGGRATKDENAKVVFRAVFAAGSDVWAGGSGGMLYHSIDGGEQWSEVRPFAANESSAADILSIEFSDGMRGKITTSRPELWVTSNGGESWQQQKQ
jgi:hypothetical protein